MREYLWSEVSQKSAYLPSVREFEEWFTTSEAASSLGKSRQGVVWLCENRRLRAARTRLAWLVDPNDVERYAREHGAEEMKEDEADACNRRQDHEA
jgi:excisionase family DNA binding protein